MNKPTCYIAGNSNELDRIALCMEIAKAVGFEIKHDWTVNIKNHGNDDKPKGSLSHLDKRRIANEDLDAALGADVLWYAVGATKSEGSAAEHAAVVTRNRILATQQELFGPTSVQRSLIIVTIDRETKRFPLFAHIHDAWGFDHEFASMWLRPLDALPYSMVHIAKRLRDQQGEK